MFGPHLIPELEELLNLVETKEASRQGPLNTSPPHWDDRRAAFVYVPEVTQRAIVHLLREMTALPLDFAIKDFQRQLNEKDAALEPLRQKNEELALLINNRDNQLSDRGEEIKELRAANTKMERELVECRKQRNVPREQQEADRAKARKEVRTRILEATAGQTIDQRFESFLASVSLYLTSLDAPDVKQLEPAKLAEHFKHVRARLMKIDDEVTIRFKRLKKASNN